MLVPDDIYRIKFLDATVWQSELIERYNSLQSMKAELPLSVAITKFLPSGDADDLTIEEISDWFSSVKLESTPDPTKPSGTDEPEVINTVALTLALCGWGGQKLAGVQFA